MIIDLPSTTTSQVNKKLVEIRETGGAVALGRVLTLAIITDDGSQAEQAIEAANDASREHPCRVIVLARGARKAAARLDAQIRVGGDAGASEVVVLRMYGPLADEGASCLVPLLLPDAPVVAWWPLEAPKVPAEDPIGKLAHRRITDAKSERNPVRSLEQRRSSYRGGDTDLAWTRLTSWRAYLAAALDLPPHEPVTRATVTGNADSPSTQLLAGWLASCLDISVRRVRTSSGQGIVSVVLERRSGLIELVRPDGQVATLTQPGQPDRTIALPRRSVRDCLIEELRRLDPDEVYEDTLEALPKVVAARGSVTTAKSSPAARSTSRRTATSAKSTARAAEPGAGGRSAGTAKSTRLEPASSEGTGARNGTSKRGTRRTGGATGSTTGAAKRTGGRRSAAPKPARRGSVGRSARGESSLPRNHQDTPPTTEGTESG
ncbi:glucose-6-phosphate dehydrogenase assembly protein OpcA [Actinoalloteichus spitiensis]|uniref:glucose-6-phosphate dehydrogenase assembly protein OpcA n=1 Tax=Actinoalloteichus spitiensis TaxID=252394 RepID=UPI00037AC835|nr:glucose-6-phosphate dehydrogenase assembly protein OpcA [Actinoalloteichus spitiensis]